MNLRYPIISDNLFLQYKTPMQIGNVVSKKKGKTKQFKQIRNNTRNILDEKYKMFVEQSAQIMSEPEYCFEFDLDLIIDVKITKAVPKMERFIKRKNARNTKRFLQDLQYDVPIDDIEPNNKEKELNLLDLIRELEQSDKAKDEKYKRDLYDLQLWVLGVKTFQKYCENEKHERYEAVLRNRAKRYIKSNQISYQKFVEKVRKERRK